MKKQFIKCPECGAVELAESLNDKEIVDIHVCSKCSILIFQDDWKPLKALSIKQPWASFIVEGHKDIENRNTLKNFRGTFLIHAGVSIDFNWRRLKHTKSVDVIMNYDKFERGGIIGHAEIYDCVTKSDSPWFIGKNGLLLRNARTLPFTPCKGKLSFFYPEID